MPAKIIASHSLPENIRLDLAEIVNSCGNFSVSLIDDEAGDSYYCRIFKNLDTAQAHFDRQVQILTAIQ